MPSSRKTNRPRKQQRFDQQQERPLASSPEDTTPALRGQASPHPYHAPLPPNYHPPFVPNNSKMEGRSTSLTSNVSDVSMDDLSGNQDSVFYYSDTSGEEREDHYFMPDASTGGPRNLLGSGNDRSSSGESAFRNLRGNGSKSSRVLKYSFDGSNSVSFNQPLDAAEIDDSLAPPVDAPVNHHHGHGHHHASSPSNNNNNNSKKPTLKAWVTNLAYSFRSPDVNAHHKSATPNGSSKHRSQPSWGTMEYPHTSLSHEVFHNNDVSSDQRERAPLIQPSEMKMQGAYGSGGGDSGDAGIIREKAESSKPRSTTLKSKSTAATVAAFFLMDYEASRPPTLSPRFETITPWQLCIYRIQFSWIWRLFGINLPIIVLFLAHSQSRLVTALMHTYAIIFFFIEVWMREQLYALELSRDEYHSERRLNRPLVLFLLVLGLESWIWFIFPPDPQAEVPALVSSIFKPVVFFYVSLKARHALEGLSRITNIVARVIMIEMLLILAFAAVGSQLYHNHESFKDLSSSWLSLFELSTTVTNPSLWMPMYEVSRSNAIFFVFFIIVSVFYLHSLVLSVVFQTYIHAATEIHQRAAMDREEAIRRAFVVLLREESSEYISASSVRKTLQIVRPHYNALKIKALMDILDPTDQHAIDYPTFRTKIRQALNASIRTARSNTSFAMGIELIAVLVALLNFAYVILLTSAFSADWFDTITVSGGSVITFLGMFELAVRFNPTRIANFTPITRLNPAFDGLALIGALISCFGIVQYLVGDEGSINYLLVGRAIDTIRMMRFFPMFRDIVRRSTDVLPAMAGPLLLVATIVHIFVSLGIALWGGAIDTVKLATNDNLTHLYYLNNFNSYVEGLVTIFNVLVVNDWHAIAQVFLYANRCSSPYIVYPFFVATICCAVFIMLNVITAFFVESFVTKIDDSNLDFHDDDNNKVSDFSIITGENSNARRISASRGLTELSEPTEEDPFLTSDEVSAHSTTSTLFAFDVYEREGFDQIMRTVAGGTSAEEETFARSVCDYLEVFESLAPGREKVGYMICCQQSMNRFGNRRFQNTAKDYLQVDVLHKVVSDMHSELLVLSSRKKFDDRCLVRTFKHKSDPSLQLEITASLLRHQPAVSLLVSRIRPASADDP